MFVIANCLQKFKLVFSQDLKLNKNSYLVVIYYFNN